MIFRNMRRRFPWPGLLVLPLLLGIWGIRHGLPLHIIGDEESLVGGALTMLQLHTIIPSLNPSAFDLLYYPVIIPYLIIIFISPVLVWKFVVLGFSTDALIGNVLLNQNSIWIASRSLSVISTLLLIVIIYTLGVRLYSRRTALYACILFSFSFFSVSMSHWIRHWPLSTLAVYGTLWACIYVIDTKNRRVRWLPGLIAAIGMGISYVTWFGYMIVAGIVLKFKKTLGQQFWSFVIVNTTIALILGIGIVSFYYQDVINHFLTDDGQLGVAKSLAGLVLTMGEGILTFIRQETILFISAFIGLLFAHSYRKANQTVYLLFLLYLIILYFFTHFEARYIYLFLPAFAWVAGSAFEALETNRGSRMAHGALIVATCIAALIVIRFDILLSRGTTYDQAMQWMRQHASSQMVIASPVIILPRSAASLELDEAFGRIRAVERYRLDKNLFEPSSDVSYVNIQFWDPKGRTDMLADYVAMHHPSYALIEQWRPGSPLPEAYSLMAGSTLVARFRQSNLSNDYNITGNFDAMSAVVYLLDRLGPSIDIYELQYPAEIPG